MKIYWSHARYGVWSAHFNEETKVSVEVQEVRRTDRKVAEDDAALIRDTFRRRAWIVDNEPETVRQYFCR